MSPRADAREHRFAAWLTAIAVLGLAWRVVYAVMSRHHAVGGDGFRYHFGALLLADGQGFVAPLGALRSVRVPDTGHPPGWTILLAGPTKLGLRTWLEHQIVTSVVGTATIVMTGLAGQIRELGITIRRTEINGQSGALFLDPAGLLVNVFVLDIADGQVRTVRSVINPDKLRHLGPLADLPAMRRQLRPPD